MQPPGPCDCMSLQPQQGPSLLTEVHVMLKRIAPFLGAAILALGALSACGDSPSAPVDSTSPIDQIQKLTAATDAPSSSVGETLSPNALFKPKPFESMLKGLKLTDAQVVKARRCLEQYY